MGNDFFDEGQKVWVQLDDGSRRPAVYVGEGDNATFFGGATLAYVEGAEVNMSYLVARNE